MESTHGWVLSILGPHELASVKPNLFIVGAPKCGTTAWVQYLSSHPDIFFPAIKEPHHFCPDLPGFLWTKDRADYLALFSGSGSASVVGEASVRYVFSKVAAGAIAEFNSDSRIIILVRDQEDYLPSLHNQNLFNGDENLEDFEQAWDLSGKRNEGNIGTRCRDVRMLDYKSAGKFSAQVERYFAKFPPEQIRVFHFGDWTAVPRQTYIEMLRFLGLSDDGRTEFPPVNEAARHRFQWLASRLRARPPGLLAPYRFISRLAGWKAAPLLDSLLRINSRKGSLTQVSEAGKAEIRRYYEADNARLEKYIWRPSLGTR